MNISHCPNCKSEIKSGTFTTVTLKTPLETEFINEFNEEKKDGYCSRCPQILFANMGVRFNKEKERLQESIYGLLHFFPVISINNPYQWDYQVIDMVTSQYVIGTGGFTELKAGFSDALGMRSSTYGKKLKTGEEVCKSELRYNALNLNGNAIIDANITYSEIGGDKGMLMVCMSGTAIKLKNSEIIMNRSDKITQLVSLSEKFESLKRFNGVNL